MLTIFRRHLRSCPHRSRRYRRCRCPIHVEGTLGRESIRRSLDLTSWEAAENLIFEWSRSGKIGGRLAKSCTVKKAIELYTADAVARKLSAGSIYRYRAFLERAVLPWCEHEGIEEVRELTFEELARFRASWTTWSAYTSAKNLELLRMFLRFCVRAKWIEENGAEGLQSPKVRAAPTLPFTPDEEARILAACDRMRAVGPYGKNTPDRVRAFVLTLRYTGLRIGDVATMEVTRLKGNSILLYTHKTGQAVYVPIPEFVADELRKQAKLNPNPKYFFWTGRSKIKCVTLSWQRSLRALFKKATVENAFPHRYRDSFAVSLLLNGVPIEDVAVLLGHSSTKVTEEHYSPWVASRQERLEELVARTWTTPQRRLHLVG